ncbi:MAG: hypothetical protein IJT27_05985 [Clostridia bacterium]|nr:hypothetical protein [Clostridia bacterium]
MKKALFILFRTVTVLSTLFWSACCVPIVGFCVGMYADDILRMQTWQFIVLFAAASGVGILTAVLFGKRLPKFDLVLSVLLPPAFVGAEYCVFTLMDVFDSTFGVVLAYVSGALCFAAGIAAAVYFVRNAKKHKN